MDHFGYKDGVYYAEDVSIPTIAQAVGTPFYCYSAQTFIRHYHVFSKNFAQSNSKVCFAVKANSNVAVLSLLAREGAGADVVSEGEIRLALAAGVAPSNIVFSGVGKSKAEMAYALKQGIFQFNVESVPELEQLSDVAVALGMKAPIALRVNPDVDPKTHAKISTGQKESKFGISMSQAVAAYAKAASLPGIDVRGVSVHIGSQLTSLEPFGQAFARVRDFVLELRKEGHNIQTLDLGGGLGIPYGNTASPPEPEAYAKVVHEAVDSLGCQLVFEPGRLIAGNAGILVTRVMYVKESETRKFVIADAAMNDLMRPSLYDAHHDILPVVEPKKGEVLQPYDVVGPVCETGDIFAEQRSLPVVGADDLLVIRSAGAYGAVMAGTYNARLLIPEVMVNGGRFDVIRERQTYDALIGRDMIPDWLCA